MRFRHSLLAFALATALGVPLAQAEPFTFQGYVENAGNPINGSADLTFRVYGAASGGSAIGGEVNQAAYPVSEGVFTIDLDFGTGLSFDGSPRFLEIEVDGQLLNPRIEILPAPVAASANALRGLGVSATAPVSGDVLTWNGSQWAAQAPSGGGGSYSAGTGLALAGSTFSVVPSFQLPQACSNGQLAQWNGSGWVCANNTDTVYSAGNGLTLAGTVFSVDFAGNGVAPNAARSDHDHYGHQWFGSTNQAGLYVANQSSVAQGAAFFGVYSGGALDGAGVRGMSGAPQGGGVVGVGTVGVRGISDAVNSAGVIGQSTAMSGSAAGVQGSTDWQGSYGVMGANQSPTGTGTGVYGFSASSDGIGVLASGTTGLRAVGGHSGVVAYLPTGGDGSAAVRAIAEGSGQTIGVLGDVFSTSGLGVSANNFAPSGAAVALQARTQSPDGIALRAEALTAAAGSSIGIEGRSLALGGTGVRGVARLGVLGEGVTAGVEGRASDPIGAGVLAVATAATGQTRGLEASAVSPDGAGVFASNGAGSGSAYGVYAQTNSTEGTAVIGDALAASGSPVGVHGRSVSPSGVAMRAENTSATGSGNALVATGAASGGDTLVVNANGSGSAWAIRASSAGTNGRVLNAQLTNNASTGVAIYSQVASASARAGQFVNLAGGEAARFDGNVNVFGNHTVSGTKSFRIDHPLDPESRYLLHYNLEGPEPFNLYRGTVKLDMTGAAEIELPEYFEAINIDLSYQLTAVGAAMPNLHVAREVEGNRFAIAGGAAGKRVSWQVTAVRNDPWVRDRGFEAEVEKPEAEKGRYLYPAGYGADGTRAIGYEARVDKSELR